MAFDHLFAKFRTRWMGSIRVRHTVWLFIGILVIMGIGSAMMLDQQGQTIRKAAESRGLAFSRTFALMGAAAVMDNLFRIQEAMSQYLEDPDLLQIDVIDRDNMIVASKHTNRIGTLLSESDWLVPMQSKTEIVSYTIDSAGKPILVIVEPLLGKDAVSTWIRIMFSLDSVRQTELRAFRRMLVITLVLIATGILGIGIAQRQVSRVLRGIIKQLQDALASLGGSEFSQGVGSVVTRVPRSTEFDKGEIEYLTESVLGMTTLLKSQSEALRKSRGLIQAILDHTTAVIYLKDLEGRYVLSNRQHGILFHMAPDDVVGKSDYDLFPKEMADAFRANDRKVTETGVPLALEELTPHDDGPHPYLSLKFPLRDADGLIYAVCGISTDITDRKRAEEALHALTVSLEQKVKERTHELEAARDHALVATRHKSEFLASMSHELRTPLNAIIGFSEVLVEKMFGDLNPKQEEYLVDILSSGRHLLSLINDILDLSKVESGRIELEVTTFDFPMACEHTATLVREKARRHGIQLTLEVDPRVGLFTADERKVKQVLINLLSNAIKFTSEGGSISLGVDLKERLIEVSVTDSGIGISVNDQEKIFDEFYQAGADATRRREGTGLGLALAKKFVELHGGHIWVESQIGLGSTFAFTLPARAPIEKELFASAELTAVPEERPLVLVIEDDAPAAKLLSIYLREAGFHVELAEDGMIGFQKAQSIAPAVITLDILIPKVDGWDLLTHLKADRRTAHIPVVIVSIVDERGKGFALGAAGYLTKPVDRDGLIDAIRRIKQSGASAHLDHAILTIDDDRMLLELMDAVLRPEGYTIIKAKGGRDGLNLARQCVPGLIVLDLLMPDLDGFQVVDELKRDPATAGIPIIVLTNKTLTREEKDLLNGRIIDLKQKSEFNRASFVAHVRTLLCLRES